ncbi:hypothetical protein DPMN_192602 [Dreissena polymorpha]|uniref:Uncharacterized protein n=1 Tax=Dreissena polymorpha TaxID=45954 RepID=A0A9D4BF96_DREPO|nr:hypothetical protein DPMN_192602 [Dreissena polymorpha]
MSPTIVVGDIKMPQPPGSHVFQQTRTIFGLIQDIRENVPAKFHENWTINVAFRPYKKGPARSVHVFKPTGNIFQLVQDIIGTILLTKFHYDRTINVASRVLTRFYYSHIKNKMCL